MAHNIEWTLITALKTTASNMLVSELNKLKKELVRNGMPELEDVITNLMPSDTIVNQRAEEIILIALQYRENRHIISHDSIIYHFVSQVIVQKLPNHLIEVVKKIGGDIYTRTIQQFSTTNVKQYLISNI